MKLRILEPKLTHCIMDLTLLNLSQTRGRLENCEESCLAVWARRFSGTHASAPQHWLKQPTLPPVSLLCVCDFPLYGWSQALFMRLCFKRFLTPVARYNWLSGCTAIELVQQLLLNPTTPSDINKLSHLAGITITAHFMCRHGELTSERHPIVLACRKWHTRH
eukprot:6491248-Amphidinium_carterae.3